MPDKKSPVIPKHIAIIPDGNRRWAKKRGLPAWKGHIEGAKRIEEIAETVIDAGIPYCTFWGGSYENLTERPPKEINTLNRVYKQLAEQLLKNKKIFEKDVRIHILGEWKKLLQKPAINALDKVIQQTQNHSRCHLIILVGYSGNREMLSAINKATKGSQKRITSTIIKSNLWTKESPPLDFVIRTGGEYRLSAGFMMWDIQHAELYFSPKMWPDFKKQNFLKALKEYSSRERRFGK